MEKTRTLSTDAGMHALWRPEAFSGVRDYDTWEPELCEDEDIERHVRAAALVPVNIGFDGVWAFTVRVGAELSERERTYRTVSSEPYLFESYGRACLSGIEHIEAEPDGETTETIDLPAGRYDVTVHLIEWDREPGACDEDGQPRDFALPDFLILINPAAPGEAAHRTKVRTFEPLD